MSSLTLIRERFQQDAARDARIIHTDVLRLSLGTQGALAFTSQSSSDEELDRVPLEQPRAQVLPRPEHSAKVDPIRGRTAHDSAISLRGSPLSTKDKYALFSTSALEAAYVEEDPNQLGVPANARRKPRKQTRDPAANDQAGQDLELEDSDNG